MRNALVILLSLLVIHAVNCTRNSVDPMQQVSAPKDSGGSFETHLDPSIYTAPLAVRSAEGQVRQVRLSLPWYCEIPGNYKITATIMDTSGKEIATQEFSAGWRVYVASAVVKSTPEDGDYIELSLYNIVSDEYIGRTRYRLTHDRLIVLR
jgi:hypothetical protein